MIVYSMKNKILHEKIGNLILDKYLNPDNITKRNIFTSDITRLIYLIFQIIGKEKNWLSDKNGMMLTEMIIDPIMDKIKKIMNKYGQTHLDNYDESYDKNDENAEILLNVHIIQYLKSEDYRNELKKNILKHMASKFSIAGKKNELFDLIE